MACTRVTARGDTVITTYHGNGGPGPESPHRKWQVECFDGEAAVGIGDNIWDFGALTYVFCKFMFPFKPPSQGVYPYYPYCFVKDYLKDPFCYSKNNHSLTANTFVTGYYDTDFVWWTFFPPNENFNQPYKCCRLPRGYYIDYLSCYYVTTHDLYFEYYDGNFFLVQCATGYVITGTTAKQVPIHNTYQGYIERRIEWIQCCRVGWGAIIGVPPPIINVPGRPPAYSGQYVTPPTVPAGYAHQYRKKRSVPVEVYYAQDDMTNHTINIDDEDIYMADTEIPLPRAPFTGDATHYDVHYTVPDLNIAESVLRL
ncbi:hypothetical protein RvY_06219-2 [Ramazzottius varieornatus]|uniref:Uncharacterized protein n=1 Tax=Ramazzottius varieornatus TaxID=947166 RepID=A0A1D1V7H1_RAMVA|nr:hypothetical protein RvY_06219-2 [Ramazzottius varieornatus]